MEKYSQDTTGTSGPDYGAHPVPKRWLALSIITTVCCCLIFGIVGIVYSCKVETLYNKGDFQGAEKASRRARNWSIAGIIFGILFYIFWVVLILVGVYDPDIFTRPGDFTF